MGEKGKLYAKENTRGASRKFFFFHGWVGTRQVLCKVGEMERLENFSLPKTHLFSLQVPFLGSRLRVVSLFAPAATAGGVED